MTEKEKKELEEKKEYLKSYGKALRQMERSKLKMAEIRANQVCPSVANDGMPHAHDNSDLSQFMALLDEEERRYLKFRYQRIKLCTEIVNKIERMDNEDEKDVLMLRYIRLMKWEDICVEMHLSWRRTHYIHSAALEHFVV